MATSNHDGTWTLSQAEYRGLMERDRFLQVLENTGADNWDGWEEACRCWQAGIGEDI